MDELMTLIGNYAFPIVCCVALFLKMDKDQQRHSEESEQLRKSLDNNTKALLELGAHIKES